MIQGKRLYYDQQKTDEKNFITLPEKALEIVNQQREMVLPGIETTIETLKKNIFPIHGL